MHPMDIVLPVFFEMKTNPNREQGTYTEREREFIATIDSDPSICTGHLTINSFTIIDKKISSIERECRTYFINFIANKHLNAILITGIEIYFFSPDI